MAPCFRLRLYLQGFHSYFHHQVRVQGWRSPGDWVALLHWTATPCLSLSPLNNEAAPAVLTSPNLVAATLTSTTPKPPPSPRVVRGAPSWVTSGTLRAPGRGPWAQLEAAARESALRSRPRPPAFQPALPGRRCVPRRLAPLQAAGSPLRGRAPSGDAPGGLLGAPLLAPTRPWLRAARGAGSPLQPQVPQPSAQPAGPPAASCWAGVFCLHRSWPAECGQPPLLLEEERRSEVSGKAGGKDADWLRTGVEDRVVHRSGEGHWREAVKFNRMGMRENTEAVSQTQPEGGQELIPIYSSISQHLGPKGFRKYSLG